MVAVRDLPVTVGTPQTPWADQAAHIGCAGHSWWCSSLRVGPLTTEQLWLFYFDSSLGSPESKGRLSSAASLRRAERREGAEFGPADSE